MAGNANLGAARAVKNDEFYTQWNDIENEMQAYLEYDPGVFRGKTVLLPCDDPEWSNFTRFFVHNFTAFGIKKLVSTSYMPRRNGRIFVMESGSKSDGRIEWGCLDSDGDFRSEEVTALRDEADMVITNPPFSLFREFMAWLAEGGVEFSTVGSMNAITYKEIFPLIKENEMWLGASRMGAKYFTLPSNAPVKANQHEENGVRFQKFGNIAWFTNIEHGRRHEPLPLMTMDDNLLYGSKRVRETAYVKYDNYDAIEVPETKGIPSDYPGVMGVPISFLDKYSPGQFEIVSLAAGNSYANTPSEVLKFVKFVPRVPGSEGAGQGVPVARGKKVYARVLIRHRHPTIQSLSRSRGGQSSLGCKRGFSHVEVRG